MKRIAAALVLCPLLALADQGLAFAWAMPSCARQQAFTGNAIHVVALVACLTLTALAWREMRAAAPARAFLGWVASGTGALCCLVIVALWLPQWLLSPCIA
jgi:hypothetical protein